MGLKIALELILKYYLFNKTKILGISEVKTFKMVNYTRHGCFSSTSKVFQECRPKKKQIRALLEAKKQRIYKTYILL